ncbi:MAG: glycosyltransferase [Owenweeksia sp.]|nr:glycosyltransferase [Owenweeksia sp.]MBF98613.1 glycosyltransferase [Owenweeksia sp.]HBF21737.1 glycosyltransferase [Cryomorphaceae bacterium]HCQ16116.1 glycosyltransferase [Cryomorphaceae bacterium]|tara:strand:+ start:236 stop:835 length:600 start_codon:yes stop_codon:yes gene_type:complete
MPLLSDRLLLIFIKNPIQGKVKTRLGKDLGHHQAVEIYKKLLEVTRLAALGVNAARQLYYGDFINQEDNWSPQDFEKKLQHGNDLGARMHEAFVKGFDEGYKKIVIIGSDCPEMDAQTLEEAFRKLEDHNVVIGPANDGGYYLLGLSQKVNIFENVDWSTESVFDQTLAQVKKQGLSRALLPEKTDLDTIDDLKKFPDL